MSTPPVDVVDRRRPRNLHGVTWHAQADAMLDYIGKMATERDNALLALLAFLEAHPDLESDPNLTQIGLALL